MFVALILWYCMDDWLARATNTPWVGDVPWFVVIAAIIILSIIFPRTVTVSRSS